MQRKWLFTRLTNGLQQTGKRFVRSLVLSVSAAVLTAVMAGNSIADTKSDTTPAMDHSQWNGLLQQHVVPVEPGPAQRYGVVAGSSTQVSYAGFATHRTQLKEYLNALSDIRQSTFENWPKADQLAFLINAYNAWTIELILTKYPDLKSIKDLGSFFSSPWSKKIIPLLGKHLSLDDVEHQLIRNSGRYNEPRIHFAVNCASIGCPALRGEAYEGSKIEQQLEDQTKQFLADSSRNRFKAGKLHVSSIFKWYRDDFEKGWGSYHSLEAFLQPTALSLS